MCISKPQRHPQQRVNGYYALLFRPTFAELEHHMTYAWILFIIAIGLYGLSLMNFALALYLTLFLSLPLSLSTSQSTMWVNVPLYCNCTWHCFCVCFRSKFLLLLFSPPLIAIYSCSLYIYLFSSSHRPLQDGITMAVEGLAMAYRSHFVSGAWLYPMATLLVVPFWWVCWVGTISRVSKTLQKHHVE